MFTLYLTLDAQNALSELANSHPARHRKALKTLSLLQLNLRHPSLQTHQFMSLKGPNDEKVFVAYVENKTPGAYRIF